MNQTISDSQITISLKEKEKVIILLTLMQKTASNKTRKLIFCTNKLIFSESETRFRIICTQLKK